MEARVFLTSFPIYTSLFSGTIVASSEIWDISVTTYLQLLLCTYLKGLKSGGSTTKADFAGPNVVASSQSPLLLLYRRPFCRRLVPRWAKFCNEGNLPPGWERGGGNPHDASYCQGGAQPIALVVERFVFGVGEYGVLQGESDRLRLCRAPPGGPA
jgi:hypothetical protein